MYGCISGVLGSGFFGSTLTGGGVLGGAAGAGALRLIRSASAAIADNLRGSGLETGGCDTTWMVGCSFVGMAFDSGRYEHLVWQRAVDEADEEPSAKWNRQ